MTTLTLNRSARRASLAGLLLAATLVMGVTACAPQEQDGATVGSAADGEASTQTLDAAAFADLVATDGVVVVDVRTPQEYAEGHLDGALNLDVSAPDFATAIAALDPDVTYALYCRSGNRSAQAMDVMSSAGMTSLAHLDGGVGAWTSAGGDLVTGS
ncbi:rhodanese-like domain-containing protein [Cellulomonas sp. KRMCY2]|uniref:rhodanese-like domain-containing protein n=1 Tax=Cellulomonas sp. KRMCY2 TaxID=1304865 RepID=UPI00045E958D|nr:rhodanese-like domain-containing protein [Cellulomonas sp. KRMCY2]